LSFVSQALTSVSGRWQHTLGRGIGRDHAVLALAIPGAAPSSPLAVGRTTFLPQYQFLLQGSFGSRDCSTLFRIGASRGYIQHPGTRRVIRLSAEGYLLGCHRKSEAVTEARSEPAVCKQRMICWSWHTVSKCTEPNILETANTPFRAKQAPRRPRDSPPTLFSLMGEGLVDPRRELGRQSHFLVHLRRRHAVERAGPVYPCF